jgi:hypothetical protein
MALSLSLAPSFLTRRRCAPMRARSSGGARARGGGDAAGEDMDARCEVFSHPVYGRAVRARVAVPAHTTLLEELPLLYGQPPARLDAVCDEVRR